MISQTTLKQLIEEKIKPLNLSVDCDLLAHYLFLLHQWNQAYNLTAIRDVQEMVLRHVLDSLSIVPWIQGERLLDVGTGAGLPGIPIAIACPQLRVVLLDSNGKKIRFLNEVKRVLKLDQVDMVHERMEHYHPTQAFDTITSRALSDVSQMLIGTQHLIAPNGIWLAMKARFSETERSHLTKPYQVKPYIVPELPGERCCVIVQNKD